MSRDPPPPHAVLVPICFDAMPAWRGADPAPAFSAFRRSAPALLSAETLTGVLGPAAADLKPAAEAALRPGAEPGEGEARAFFERFFRPALLQPAAGGSGFVTGYYEPVVAASRVRDARFTMPLYRRPDDLVTLAPGEGPPGLEPAPVVARRLADGSLAEYPDRAAIEDGALAGRGLELAFLESAVDAFFIHVQGSARLGLPDGTTMRVGYAAKNGHRFTAIGRILVAQGELTLEAADMEGIRRWLAAHPDRADALLRRNRSFIFFREVTAEDGEGPVGAAGVPLTPLASLAVDRALHTFGTPVFVEAPTLRVEEAPFARLMVAQDTGSAIVGPARGDVFVGSGEAAGRIAGRIRDAATMHLLLPAGPTP